MLSLTLPVVIAAASCHFAVIYMDVAASAGVI